MLVLSDKIEQLIKKHREELMSIAKTEFPKECCGVIAAKGKKTVAIQLQNTHHHPTGDFECSVQSADLEDEGYTIIAVFHSHTNSNNSLTESDIVCMNSCQKPYILICEDSVTYGLPKQEVVPYKQRKYVGGVQDCYTLVRDYYLNEYSISLKDFYRCSEWWNRGMDILTDANFKAAGFYPVRLEDIRVGDVVVMQFGDKNDHLAIYIGKSKILHHCYNKLSCEDMYGGVWLKHTTSIQRYKGFQDEQGDVGS